MPQLRFGRFLAWTVAALCSQSASAALRPRAGGSLERGFVGVMKHLDPLLAESRAEREAALQIHAGLYRIGPEGEPLLDLVEREDLASDGLSVRLRLRNCRFHDGQPVRAQDAARSIQRFAAETGAGALFGTGEDQPPVARALGERELWLRIDLVPSLWRWLLADPRAGVIPEGGGVDGHIGAGAFRVDRVEADGKRLLLVPWLGHFRGRPLLDQISYRSFNDESQLLLAHRRQGVDVVEVEGSAPEGTRAGAMAHDAIGLALASNRPPLDSIALRETIAAALRIEALVEVVLAGRVEPIAGLLGLRPGPREEPASGPRPQPRSPLRAGARPLVLHPGDESLRTVAERLRVDLDAAGIATVLGGPPWDLALVRLPGGDGVPELELADVARLLALTLPESLRLAASADPRSPRPTDRLQAERELLAPGTLIPLFRRTHSVLVSPAIRDLGTGAGGLVSYEDAWRWPRAPTP